MCLNDDLFQSHILLHSPLLVEILCIALMVVLLSLFQQALGVFDYRQIVVATNICTSVRINILQGSSPFAVDQYMVYLVVRRPVW